jgi:glycosyltransferase involved in cell wall biosynthesis
MRHVVVMLTTSYPRFPGDGVGSFMEPIAKGVAARGHEVHVVAPWHPALTRAKHEDGVSFHFYRYAPLPSLNVFGYAAGLREDTHLRLAAWAMTPAALAAGWFKAWRVATKRRATVVHAHWVIPGGVTGLLARGGRPLVVSLHGSDVYVAERHPLLGRVARTVFSRASWITACSEDLRVRAVALGAPSARSETVPYGVDAERFAPGSRAGHDVLAALGLAQRRVIFAAGRLVRKKGFEFLIDAARLLASRRADVSLVIAGDGDLRDELLARAAGLPAGVVQLIGTRPQSEIGRLAAAADVVVIPSVHDRAGNVDGLPNFALEALATATPVVATAVGGLPQVVRHLETGLLVEEQNAELLASAIERLLSDPPLSHRLGGAARDLVTREFGWGRTAERFEAAYDRAVDRREGP